MELRHLESFIAVAEELHFTRAAERLHVAQSPLSQRIRALERELGVTLLERTNRRVALTEAGAAFLEQARATLRAAKTARCVAARHRDGEAGTLRLGFVASAAFDPLPSLLRTFHARAPDVRIEVRRLDSAAQFDALHAHEIDAGLARRRPDAASGLAALELAEDPFVAVLPASHLRADHEPLALVALQPEPWILARGSGRSDFNRRIRIACGRAGFEPRVDHYAPDQPSILALVAAGLGVSVVPDSVARLSAPGAAATELRPEDRFALPTVLVWRDGDPTPVLARLRDAAKTPPRPTRDRIAVATNDVR